jgi:hypothetical protein
MNAGKMGVLKYLAGRLTGYWIEVSAFITLESV